MGWDYWETEPPPVPKEEESEKLTWTQKFCTHEWKKTQLIISTVSDCVKCGAKKEDIDEWENNK